MKRLTILILMTVSIAPHAYARRGAHDGAGDDDGRVITCTDSLAQRPVLRFASSQVTGKFENDNYSLEVKARGDDVGEMTVVDKRSSDSVRAKALEELVKVWLTTEESSEAIVAEMPTHQGEAVATVAAPSGDHAEVSASSRRGRSVLRVTLITDELAGSPVTISCSNER